MATTLSPPTEARGRLARSTSAAPAPGTPRAERPGRLLAFALIAALLYAAFADGAVAVADAVWVEVGLAAIALAGACAWLFGTGVHLRTSRAAWAGVALLLGYAVWAGVTLLWSVAPDRAWEELNRGLAYVLVVVLAIAVGSSDSRGIERLALGWLGVAGAVALYALGGKVLPGIAIPGLFDLDHTREFSRLRAPLGYWNALGMVCALGVPVAMRLASDLTRAPRWRLAGLAVLFVLLAALGMTYSRGAVLALALGVAVATWLGGARLRGLVVLAVTGLAVLPVLGYAFVDPALSANGAELGARIRAGLVLGAVMAVCLGGLLLTGWGLLRMEGRVRWSPRRSALVWKGAAALAAVLALLGVVSVAGSERGLGGTASALADSFTGAGVEPVSDPARLLSTSSANRWSWWQEAAGAAADRPVGGWGAASFSVIHRLYRTDQLAVSQPHNVPLQLLAETGLVGAALALGGLGVLLVAALLRVRAMAPGRARELAAALVAGSCAWLAHGLLDWDWNIPGVTLPALAFLGVALARPGVRRPAPGDAVRLAAPEPGGGLRGLALTGCVLLLCAVAASALLPAWARAISRDALVTSAGGDEEARRAAANDALFAAGLDPLSAEPLIASATVAQARGRLADAKGYLLEAIERQPYSVDAWSRLAQLAVVTADRDTYAAAARRLLVVDPLGQASRVLSERGGAFVTPPGLSPTATGTPLTPARGPAVPPATTPPAQPPAATPPAATPPAQPPAATPPAQGAPPAGATPGGG